MRQNGSRLRPSRLAALCLVLTLAACRPGGGWAVAADGDPLDAQRPGRLVRLADGRRVNLRCTGRGAPTVILESGFGADSLGWVKVQRKVAETTRVCSYDRAGAGFSDPGPLPRDGVAIARDLDRTLKAAGVSGPFIIVGHSAGGLYGQVFAARRASEVVGFVFVDPSVSHQTQKIAAIAGPQAASIAGLKDRAARCLAASSSAKPDQAIAATSGCLPKTDDPHARTLALRPDTWRTQISEIETLFNQTSDQADAASAVLGDIPAIVMTADNGGATPPGSWWWELHEQLADHFRRHDHRSAASGHLIMVQQPDAVSAAILQLVTAARAGGTGSAHRF